MKRTMLILIAALTVATIPAAFAQDPETENGRYTINRVDDGFLRLDTRTGQVSICSRKTVGWGCNVVPDERTALENEIARLQTDNAALKKDMLARGLPLPGGMRAETRQESRIEPKPDGSLSRRGDPEIKLPNAADLERMRVFFNQVWQRLVEMIVNLQKDMQKT